MFIVWQGNLIAVGTYKGYTQIWDVAANKKVNNLHGHTARVGEHIFTSQRIQLWSLAVIVSAVYFFVINAVTSLRHCTMEKRLVVSFCGNHNIITDTTIW